MENQLYKRGFKVNLAFCFLLSAVGFMSSCKKFVEIPPPQTTLVTASVFSNNASATATQTYIYMQMATANGLGESYALASSTGIQSDELRNFSTGAAQVRLYTNALVAAFNDGRWSTYYNYIYQENAVIEGLQNYNGVSPTVKRQLTGEAKFIRAFWHFYLTNLYGDVPLVLTTNYALNGSSITRTPRVKVLQQVVADLKDAQNLLSTNYVDASDTISTTERVRPNKAVATALLARAYLYLGDYAKDASHYINAETQATAVISNSVYNLSPLTGAGSVFMKNSSEAIWQLSVPGPSGTCALDGQFLILTSAPTNGNTNFTAISTQLLTSFEVGDLRKTNWIGAFNTTTTPVVTYYFPYKYKTNNLNSSTTNITEYTTVLRLAEQYLIRAEARAQQSNTVGAIADLNMIRSRANLGAYAGATDKVSVLAAILHERQVELFTEWGHRWLDLNRTGNTNAVMSVVTPLKLGTWSSDGHQQLYPIPQSDILNDPSLTQNPGY